MNYRITSLEGVRYAVLRVAFDDGLGGEDDLTDSIRRVAVAEHGRSLGWSRDGPGEEMDICPEVTRIRIEPQRVEELASRYGARRSAARMILQP